MAVAEHFHDQSSYGIDVRMHLYPLPFFRNSFLITQAAFEVAEQASREIFVHFVDEMFHFQDSFKESSYGLNFDATCEAIAKRGSLIGLSHDILQRALKEGSQNSHVRLAWKDAASLGIADVPAFFFDGTRLKDVTEETTAEQWIEKLMALATRT
eukprot:m.95631 g.95631  ORF g.95631 m.95631 type:complete len:155 (-) comp21931_c0_seq5:129-593(-)